jgi:hypothetical protein
MVRGAKYLQAVGKGSPVSLRSIASLTFVFVVRVRARLDFTVTLHGHDYRKCASRI